MTARITDGKVMPHASIFVMTVVRSKTGPLMLRTWMSVLMEFGAIPDCTAARLTPEVEACCPVPDVEFDPTLHCATQGG